MRTLGVAGHLVCLRFQGAGQSTDIALRPSVTIAGKTVTVVRLLGEGASLLECTGVRRVTAPGAVGAAVGG